LAGLKGFSPPSLHIGVRGAEGFVSFREVRVECDGFLSLLDDWIRPFRRRESESNDPLRIGICESCMGQGIIEVNFDCLIEKLNGLLIIFLFVSKIVCAAFDVILISVDILGRFLLDPLFFSRRELRLEGRGNLLGDIALDGEDFLRVPSEGIVPSIRCG
jgi:hypothetical protein